MTTEHRDLVLPSSPDCLCEDRFSLTETDINCDPDNALVPAWSLVQAVLAHAPPPQSATELIAQLDTLSVAFRGFAIKNSAFLNQFIQSWARDAPQRFFAETWPGCVRIALEMPALFPEGYLRPLTRDAPAHYYSRRQIACLVVHQFMCTLARPSWMQADGSPDFSIWYADEQPHPMAVRAYLHALFTYFERISQAAPSSEQAVSYTLHHAPAAPLIPPGTRFTRFTLVEVAAASTSPLLLGLPSGACVISANKHVGFGRTASQEEMHVGGTPEACPAVLVTPPLGAADALVVRGAESTVEITGYGRAAALTAVLRPGEWAWAQRTMLFMDALELDAHDTRGGRFMPDLLPGNVARELAKACAAFGSGEYAEVVTGLWGCGAFGGNAEVKTVVQWCAASAARVPIKFVCESTNADFLAALRIFVERVETGKWTVDAVLHVLYTATPHDPAAQSMFQHVADILS
ncbi:poly glycohydrolase isoform [Athelia psychrophila]|uniref:poly(ADP-ribose) glycohydrolase n=1 Tax=Athelia psychrophila TaxID=1759441 RepID=A0A166L3S4_9AGAM|nr:poly glycohydrolase isoform [Fibularhizoctonia sp. CBS 109695]